MMIDEPQEFTLKRYEELYRLAKESYNSEQQRFDAVEAKIARYLSFLVVILGLTAIKIDDFVDAVTNVPDIVATVFSVSYASLFTTSVIALFGFLRVLSIQQVVTPPIDDTLTEHYEKNRYIDVLASMARGFLTATQRDRDVVDRKFLTAAGAYNFLRWALAFAAATVVSFVVMKLCEGY